MRLTAACCMSLLVLFGEGALAAEPPPDASGKSALTVTLTSAAQGQWAQAVSASGNVMAWQEAVIGAEQGGQRLLSVDAEVGQRVRKGQLLARMNDAAASADLAQARAQQAEAEAALAEARANAVRARSLREQGFYSAQALSQYLTAEQTAQARLDGARAALASADLRLAQTRVLAPDDGVISAREAVTGSLVSPGQELFRLIRQGRLEWRAEVAEAHLPRIRAGQMVRVRVGEAEVTGRVRTVAPAIDVKTRNALVYVDLGPSEAARAGMFARGEIVLGESAATSLPQSAVVAKDGFDFVFAVGTVSGDKAVVKAMKVATGRRQGGRVEILSGLAAGARVVATGGAFLADGDTVRIVAK